MKQCREHSSWTEGLEGAKSSQETCAKTLCILVLSCVLTNNDITDYTTVDEPASVLKFYSLVIRLSRRSR